MRFVEVMAEMDIAGLWGLAMVPRDGADPGIQSEKVFVGLRTEPGFVDCGLFDHLRPCHPPKRVVPFAVGLARWPPSQTLKQVGTLALECLGELAEVM